VGVEDDRLIETLERSLGVRCDDIKSLTSLTSDTWLLIDDAQLAFKAKIFWKVVVKDFEALGFDRIHVVIAATYDLVSQGTTP